MLKLVRTILVILFCIALLAAGGLYYYNYTHEDIQPPVFRYEEDRIEVSVADPQEALLQGLKAYDNVDGDISGKIQIKSISKLIDETDVKVSYIVFDKASNYAVCERTVHYTDYIKPRFHITRPMVYSVGETITFLDRIVVTDQTDGNITGRLKLVETTVTNSIPGTYSAVFSVSNRMGDQVTLPMTIQIVNRTVSMPQIVLKENLMYVEKDSTPGFRLNLKEVRDPLAEEPVRLINVTMNSRNVDTSVPGVYEVYYYYTGLSGELATAILTVVVE